MSIQNRLLLVYALIFSIVYFLSSLVIYILPRNQLLAQIDGDLYSLASELVTGSIEVGADGIIRMPLPSDLATLQTASTFLIIVNRQNEIVFQSSNLAGFNDVLDPESLGTQEIYRLVPREDTLLRVLTVPVFDDASQPIGHIQVARLLDNFEIFNRVLSRALLISMGAAFASLIMLTILTSSLFRPLEDIATVARQITRADDLSRRVPHSSRTDEIGELARAFNQTLERLDRLFRSQQRFLADVSHELRTPLTSVRGNLDLMKRFGHYDEESMDVIQDEMERMSRLLGDLLLLARADTGGLPLQIGPVELDNVLFEVYRQVRRIEKPVSVELTAVDQATILGDEDRLKQLLLNMVDNGIKYTLPGGTVRLSLTKEGGWANLIISDTGIGIPPEDLPHIFDRFYRVDKARSRAQGGSGLGLAIAKWIVQAHGGAIQVDSTVGQGTTFRITLPLNESPRQLPDRTAEIDEEALKTRTGTRPRGLPGTLRRGQPAGEKESP
ncbi:MAG: HAMP domain-containing protein [Anaerolineales bacterium]|uniref:sensor histidine kinase n=1 Tax=Promineifilum sp. TaxID=2664178 RepID=UPI001D323800|nr:HAMP domain-containing protein [Anaerolineales bacterium]MCB8935907.1 HAMP domain-containing protein [Promineifilum sp.]MCO5180692.1 ATP-binding protein [Promineifilum sp.]